MPRPLQVLHALLPLLLTALALFAPACSHPACRVDTDCPAGTACVGDGHCARTCTPDAGDCPGGTSCQRTGAYCEGTACSAAQDEVCCGDGGC